MYFLLHFVPKKLASFIFGVLTRIRLPSPLAFLINMIFVKLYRVDLSESALPITKFRNLEELFTRELLPEARMVKAPLCSPADGTLSLSLPVEEDLALQIKGTKYSLSELVFSGLKTPKSLPFKHFTTVYLAPYNYHRVHSPVAGTLRKIRYIPGKLWPVNALFVKKMPKLFCLNERLVFDIELASQGMVHVVMVGALNVGRIQTRYWPDFFTNSSWACARKAHLVIEQTCDARLQCGEELGVFMLGSTVVLAFDAKAAEEFDFAEKKLACEIKMGQSLLKKQ